MYRIMICGAQHPPVHRLRAALVRLWTGGIGDSLEFLPPLTRIGSTLAVQRGTPSVLVEVGKVDRDLTMLDRANCDRMLWNARHIK